MLIITTVVRLRTSTKLTGCFGVKNSSNCESADDWRLSSVISKGRPRSRFCTRKNW